MSLSQLSGKLGQDHYDLPMFGDEKQDIENRWQKIHEGPLLTNRNIRGVFVELDLVGSIFKLLIDKEDDETEPGSLANLKRLKDKVRTYQCSEEYARELFNKHNSDREDFLRNRKNIDPFSLGRYSEAKTLPQDCTIVIKNEELENLLKLIHPDPNYDTSNPSTKINGHTERHAQKREQILGAAFSVLAKWPNQCLDAKGEPVASKIASLVEAKANLFWPNALPPLKVDQIADHLRDWIKKANSRQ